MAVYAVTYSGKAYPKSIVPGKRYEVIEEDGPHLFRIRSETGRIISCLWDGCAFLRGDTWARIEEEEKVTLREGDYVSTAGMTEDQYHAVARAFMAAGAGADHSMPMRRERNDYMMWSKVTGNVDAGPSLRPVPNGRKLTPAQVIGAVNAGNQQEEDDMEHKAGDRFVATKDSRFFSEGSTVRFTGEYGCFGNPKMELFSGECSLNNGPGGTPGAIEPFGRFEKINDTDTLTQTLRDAAEHDEKAKHHAAEHDRLMQQAREMLPDGWMLVRGGVDWAKGEDMTDPANWRVGDVLICVDDANVHWVTKGKTYVMHGRDGDKWPIITDDDGDKLGLKPARFRLHHRPT